MLLQKTFIEDVLTGVSKKNTGQLPQYYIENNHEGIVTKQMFREVQAEIARRNSKSAANQRKRHQGRYNSKYALSERLVCGDCGSPYKRVTWNIHGRKQIVWRCVNRLEYGTKFCSHSPSIPEEELHQAILKAVQNLAANFTDEVAAQLDGILRQMKAGENLKAQLQKQLEKILDNQKKELEADEIMAAVMDSKTGKVLSVASSNRYTQYKMSKEGFSHMKANAVQYIYEPGSTIKPIVFSILLETGKLNQYEMLKTYNGKMKIGSKIITDEHKAAYMTAEDGIVFSSNIVMSQIAQRLTPSEYIGGLQKFGFGNKSQTDIAYELKGDLPNPNSLAYEIYKTTTSYGYAMRANFMQILAAYNTFNNSGIYITPKIVDKVYGNDFEERIKPEEVKRSISDMTALRMKNILKKVVEKGTGTGTKLDGLEIGGKTGTAHIAKGGSYARSFNSSFFGFANDHNSSNYTIGVLVVEPKKAHFASMTAVPVFKQIVLKMVQGGFLQAPQLLQTINAADVNKTQSTLGKDGNETTKKDPIPVQKPQKEQNKTSLKR